MPFCENYSELCNTGNYVLGVAAGLVTCCVGDAPGPTPPMDGKGKQIGLSLLFGIIGYFIGLWLFGLIDIAANHKVVFGFISGMIFNLRVKSLLKL